MAEQAGGQFQLVAGLQRRRQVAGLEHEADVLAAHAGEVLVLHAGELLAAEGDGAGVRGGQRAGDGQ